MQKPHRTYFEQVHKAADAQVAAGLLLVRQFRDRRQVGHRIPGREKRQQIGRQELSHCRSRILEQPAVTVCCDGSHAQTERRIPINEFENFLQQRRRHGRCENERLSSTTDGRSGKTQIRRDFARYGDGRRRPRTPSTILTNSNAIRPSWKRKPSAVYRGFTHKRYYKSRGTQIGRRELSTTAPWRKRYPTKKISIF